MSSEETGLTASGGVASRRRDAVERILAIDPAAASNPPGLARWLMAAHPDDVTRADIEREVARQERRIATHHRVEGLVFPIYLEPTEDGRAQRAPRIRGVADGALFNGIYLAGLAARFHLRSLALKPWRIHSSPWARPGRFARGALQTHRPAPVYPPHLMRHTNNWLFEKDPTVAPPAVEDPIGLSERMLIDLPTLYWLIVEDGQWWSQWASFPSSEFTPPGELPAPGVPRMAERRAGGYWPDAAQEPLLRAALLDGTDALAAWEAIRPRLTREAGDPAGGLRGASRTPHLDQTRRLLPLLGANLRRLGIDEPLADQFDSLRRATAARNRRLFDAGRRLLEALVGAGVATLVLKGGALAGPRYMDAGVRPMSDLDVLVPTARADAALVILRAAGWSARAPVSPPSIRMLHAVKLRDRASSVTCDLHWHAYWECCSPGADDDLWAASLPLDFEGVATRTLGPADQLLHLCVHGSRRARRSRLSWIPDAWLVLREGEIDWARLVAQARRRRFVLRTRTMLRYLEQTFGAPVPEPVLEELETLPVTRRERFEYWVGNRPQGVLGELPIYWCNYRRLRGDSGLSSPLAFPHYLQQTWRLESLGEVAAGALARAGARVRAALARS